MFLSTGASPSPRVATRETPIAMLSSFLHEE